MGKKAQAIHKSKQRYQAIPRALVFLQSGNDVLLLKGAPNKKIWPNLYNGVGGHVEPGEDVMSAARREVQEETGLTVKSLSLKAVVNIDAGDEKIGIMMFVFTGRSETRKLRASPEGSLQWVPVALLDQTALVEDLFWLLPRVLARPDGAAPLFLHYGYDENDALVITGDTSGHNGTAGHSLHQK